MKAFVAEGKNLTEAYHKSLLTLEKDGILNDCTDWNTTQKECDMTISIENPLQEPMISKCFIGGQKELQQYLMEMLDGILDFEVSKGNWAYTYHDRMVCYGYSNLNGEWYDQIDFVINELKRNPSSRRAVIMIRDISDIGSDDPTCLQHIQYFVRNGKLDCNVLFRSNDACKATFMNMFALIMLQKRIADKLGVEVGTYTHKANSFHCYEKDFDLLKGYVERIKKGDVTYDYVGDWQDDMEGYVEEIMETVNELRDR